MRRYCTDSCRCIDVFYCLYWYYWCSIVLICFPLLLSIAKDLGFVSVWFVVMMAVHLQASFLTPPFGYALFYIKSVDPANVGIHDVYKGIIPFVTLMVIGFLICAAFPDAIMWLPHLLIEC